MLDSADTLQVDINDLSKLKPLRQGYLVLKTLSY